jgi:hypothetical protein
VDEGVLLLKRWKQDKKVSESLEAIFTVSPAPGGLVVAGHRADVDRFVTEITKVGGPTASVRRVALEGASLIASAAVIGAASGEYVRLSQRTLAELQRLGAVPTDSGFYSGAIRSADGAIASFVEWAPVSLDPTQALAIQQLALTAALRAAIKEVAEAVARVESKVDDLVDLIKSERLGYAIADHGFLGRLIDSVDRGEGITDTDWSTIAHLGASISRDIEAIRTYLRFRIHDDEKRRSARSRADRLQTLVESRLEIVLAALVLAEYNLASWERIRISRLGQEDRRRVVGLSEATQAALAAQDVADQQLVTDLEAAIDAQTVARGLEGLEPVMSRRLKERAVKINSVIDWFADQRGLDVTASEVNLPGMRESLREAGRRAGGAANEVADYAKKTVRRTSDDQAAMEAADEPELKELE